MIIYFFQILLSFSGNNYLNDFHTKIHFQCLLDAEKTSPYFVVSSKQESYELIYSKINTQCKLMTLTLQPVYNEPDIILKLDQLFVKNSQFSLGLINPEFGGYLITLPSAKYSVFPFLGKFQLDSYFGLKYTNSLLSMFIGGRRYGKLITSIHFTFPNSKFKLLPFIVYYMEDAVNCSKETYIAGIEFTYKMVQIGVNYQLNEYSRKLNTYESWIKYTFNINRISGAFDANIKNFQINYFENVFERRIIYSSFIINYLFKNSYRVFLGGNYYFNNIALEQDAFELVLGISYSLNQNKFSLCSGYENPNGVLMKCYGLIEEEF